MSPWVDPNRHGWLHTPTSDRQWGALLRRYQAEPDSPLARVFEVARAGRCRTVVEENRYVDPDYRSEYSAFWSQRFPTRPAFAHRLHFFRRRLAEDELHRLRQTDGYLGYTVLKPLSPGRVGRTMLSPPPRLRRATLTLATDEVSLYGAPLSVTGFPFCEQDGEYLRCAHAAAWMCHYYAHLRGLAGRRVTAELVQTVPPAALSPERPLPSPGLTLNQIQALFGSTGQPALFYGVSEMPEVEGVENPTPQFDAQGRIKPHGLWDTRIFSVVCRYLNAGFPVLIGTADHAFVALGWFREGGRIRFVVCDDQWGPYQRIASPFTHAKGPWHSFMVPLPPKLYLSGEMAESTAHFLLRAYGALSGAPTAWQDLARKLINKEVSLRTFLRSNLGYKSELPSQRQGDDATRALRLARLPHWVWVVEVHDRVRRDRGRPSVMAEFVFDSTSWDRRPALNALSLPQLTMIFPPDDGKVQRVTGPVSPWSSHLPPR
jgi:hypothetical protein